MGGLPSPRQPMRRWLGHWLLALALLASQALGLSHAVQHGTPHAAAASKVAGLDHSGHAPGSPLCQLLGHLGLADGAPSAPTVPPPHAAVTHAAPVWLAAAELGRPAPLAYAARAPPAVA